MVEEHKGAIASLVDLKSNYGVTEGQIVQLIKFAGEWDKYWSNGKNNLQQPVATNSNGNNLSMNNLIKLNLLKSTTERAMNMLNRMGTTHMPFSLHF